MEIWDFWIWIITTVLYTKSISGGKNDKIWGAHLAYSNLIVGTLSESDKDHGQIIFSIYWYEHVWDS